MPQMQQFSDKDIASDILSGSKLLSQGYMTAILESQDQNLRQTFQNYHDQCINEHHQIFQMMQKNGWYKVPMILDESRP
ncbi:MAG: spore coat protein [Dethiobacteria bacterium]|jgi:spore coat protein CotF